MRHLLASIVLMGLVVGCVQSSTEPTSETSASTTANTHCPIMGGEVTADGGRTEWNGSTIGFCCPECQPKWEALSDEEKGEKLAADHADTDAHDHDHGGHEHS